MTMDLQEEYKQLIQQYIRKMKEVRMAERKHEDDSIVLFIDRERNAIHNELRALASKIQKTTEDITLDILAGENDLKEYLLPEFKILRAGDVFETGCLAFQKDDLGEFEEVKRAQKKALLDKAFIPFGSQEWWHLSDDFGFPEKQVWELENRRRLDALAQLMGGKVKIVELYSGKSFHTGTTVYGALFDSQDLHKVITAIQEHRTEISIDHKYFDPEQIREDVLQLIRNDIEEVLSCRPSKEENRPYLIERLKNECYTEDVPLVNEMKTEVEVLFQEAKEKGKYLDELDRVTEEVDAELLLSDKAETQFPKEMRMETGRTRR